VSGGFKYPYFNRDGTPCPLDISDPDDMEKFQELWSDDNRRVALTEWGEVRVSTVFLPIDHGFRYGEGPPLIFETMVFNYDHRSWFARWRARRRSRYPGIEYQWRYCTEESARKGHWIVVEAILDGRNPYDAMEDFA
jgi:hypothetical protein